MRHPRGVSSGTRELCLPGRSAYSSHFAVGVNASSRTSLRDRKTSCIAPDTRTMVTSFAEPV